VVIKEPAFGLVFYACGNVDQAQDIEQKEFFGRLASS
jgi:hypothetical protein